MFQSLIISGRREGTAVGAHGHGIHSDRLLREPTHFGAGGNVDHPSRETERHSQVTAVGVNANASRPSGLARDLVSDRPRRRIPENQPVVKPAAASVDPSGLKARALHRSRTGSTRVLSSRPVATSQTWIMPSSPPETSSPAVGAEGAARWTDRRCSPSSFMWTRCRPPEMSQSRTWLSTEATMLAVGADGHSGDEFSCPLSVSRSLPEATSQTLTRWS